MSKKTNIKSERKSEDTIQKPEKSFEAIFRTASRNHMQLSSMADNKAHILLNINSIIISIVLSVLTHRLATQQNLILPTAMLLMVCLVSMIFAILTTRPKIGKGVFTKDQVSNKQANLLFFGNFHQMNLETYQQGIDAMMYDKDYIHKSLVADVYYLGKALAKKYHYLKMGYRVFMYGLILSVITFILSSVSVQEIYGLVKF